MSLLPDKVVVMIATRAPIALLLLGLTVVGSLRADDADQAKFFESRIRPVLVEHCYECHSEQAKSVEGQLRLDSRAGWQSGGVSGPSVVAGDAQASLLVKAMRHADEDLKMPPRGKLPDEVVADFEKWIADGAYDPRDGRSPLEDKVERLRKEAGARWAFQRPVDPPVPEVKDAAWPKTDVDRFILAKLEAAGIAPMPPADKRTLLRRVTYDLTGLPPSPDAIAAFVADESPTALATVVDRLLASPQYGERWGRHWLDVVRYADTAGDNSDFPIPQMARYRNWTIDAFNRDLPYNEFIKQQLAGDLIPATDDADRRDKLIATGYIANARRFGSRVDDYPMHLTIEDTIDNFGRTFVGLSLNCARCHDHKFDPVSTEDYYALYGFFASTRYPWPGIELEQRQRDLVPLASEDAVRRFAEERDAKQAPLDAEVKRIEGERDAIKNDASKDEPSKEAELKAVEDRLKAAQNAARENAAAIPPYELIYAVAEGPAPGDAKVQFKGDPTKTGPQVPRRFVLALGGQTLAPDETAGSGRLRLAEWMASPENPLTARVMVNRIWQHHFVRGIVPTPNDFGKQGKSATHPELLDWLAHRFVDSGWSVKAMHRLIVNSSVYQTAALDDGDRHARDPGNELLAGFRRRRLSGEELRDTLLTLGGTLDPTPGGEHPFPPQTEWKFTQHNPFKASYPTNRRSVYVMTQRIQRDPFLATFDGADPSASTAVRTSTTTTLQSLWLLNNRLVHEQSANLARRVIAETPEADERVVRLYRLMFTREPDVEERTAAREFVAEYVRSGGDEETVWTSYVRSLTRLNEFVYLD